MMKLTVCLFALIALCHGAPQVKPKIRTIHELREQIAETHPKFQEEKPIVQVRTIPEIDEDKIARKQAESARYEFDADIVDGINGHSHSHSEKRDGLAVEGSYSYSDGFFKRTVSYVADENGFRIVKEETEPIGDGPVVDPNGSAKVHSSLGAEYEITVADLVHRV